jgi:tetratricopeptide (TPR) repeat protein
VLKAAAAIPATPQTNITVLLDDRRIVLDKDQKARLTYHVVYRVETPAGVEAWASVGSNWSPWFQKRPVIKARVIAPDAKVYTLDEKTLSDAPVHAGEEDMYDDDREYQGPLPGLTPGAIVEELTTVDDTAPFFSTGSVYREYINRPFPVFKTRVVAEAPVALALRYKVRKLGDVMAQKEEKDGVVRLTFERDNLEAIEQVAPNLPPDVAPVPEIEIATAASWKEVAERYRAMSEPQIHPEEAAAMLPKLPKNADREQTITAIVRELHRQVRYTGVEFGEAKLTPQPPSETMKRHYGDCKDKAALLVSMLRASKIPAYLALLNAGEGQDVDPLLPGMRLFDHAIVYVPAGDGPNDNELWIDATAEFAQVGDIPPPDRGRHALIIREGTIQLTTTPLAKPENNLLVEKRTFTLAENGPAQVEEVSETHGLIDEFYRARYGGAESKREREELENYVKAVYSAENLNKVEHTDGSDLSQQFQLSLVMEKAKRGYSSLQDADVALPLGGLYNRLPQWFFSTPPEAKKGKSATEEETEREENARTDDYLFDPFITEWKYRIVPPLGFKPRELPSDKKEQMGPAVLETHYKVDTDGAVVVALKFDTVRGRYTPKEAMALRQAIYDRRAAEPVMVRFGEGGSIELANGHVKEALALYRSLIARHPKEALHHIQLAMALVQAGAGEQAREEAAEAVKLEPQSALAFRSQGDVLSYDMVGRKFAPGFDRAGAIEAYRKSVKLEPDDAPTRFSLAVLYEFNEQAERFGEGAELDAAVAQYRAATSQDKNLGHEYDENTLFDLFYGGHYEQALGAAHKLNSSLNRNAVAIASVAATAGSQEGVKEAERDAEDSQARSQALGEAGQMLVRQRKYAVAAELFEAGIHDAADAPLRQRQVDIFRPLKPYEDSLFPATDPRRAVQDFKLIAFRPTVTEAMLPEIFSPVTLESKRQTKQMLDFYHRGQAQIRSVSQADGLTPDNLADVMIGSARYSVEGSDALGYRITVTSLGEDSSVSYVVKTPQGYRMLTSDPPNRDSGAQVLAFLNAGNLEGAKQWLDWSREKLKRGDGDDPLAGPLLPRFWDEAGAETGAPDANKMRIAAYSLIAGSDTSDTLLPEMEKARAAAPAAQKQDYDLLILEAWYAAHKWSQAGALAKTMLDAHPRSDTALFYYVNSVAQQGEHAALQQAGDAALVLKPNDATTLRTLSQANAFGYQYAQAKVYLKKLQDEGKANATDYNSLAWLSLFDGPVDEDALHAAQQANLLTKSSNFSIMHTLACLYADTGKTEDARQLMLQGMKADAIDTPDSAVWFAFGMIYEQYGLPDAAAAAYRKVEKQGDEAAAAEDTYLLAQQRLKKLEPPSKQQRASLK